MKSFATNDIHLAAAIKLLSIRLITIQKDVKSKKGIFIFEDWSGRENFIQSFFDGSLQGSLKRYISIWADLKSLINQLDGAPGEPVIVNKNTHRPIREQGENEEGLSR